MKNSKLSGPDGARAAGQESSWSRFVENLSNINSLSVFSSLTPAGRDADAVVSAVKEFSAPVSIVDLARKLAWDPDRLAQALSDAGENGRIAFISIQKQTFVGLPANAGSAAR